MGYFFNKSFVGRVRAPSGDNGFNKQMSFFNKSSVGRVSAPSGGNGFSKMGSVSK